MKYSLILVAVLIILWEVSHELASYERNAVANNMRDCVAFYQSGNIICSFPATSTPANCEISKGISQKQINDCIDSSVSEYDLFSIDSFIL